MFIEPPSRIRRSIHHLLLEPGRLLSAEDWERFTVRSSADVSLALGGLVEATTGLVVISGPTGSGKSTTQAALIEEINSSRARNIITRESPLEYVFSNRRGRAG